jgi:hypothetical protein
MSSASHSSPCSIYFIETGFKAEIPGFRKNFPAASFPFGGNFTFFDFALANFKSCMNPRFTVLAGSRFRGLMPFLTSRWAGDPAQLRSFEGGLDQLVEIFQSDPAECFVLVPLSLVASIAPERLQILIDAPPGSITKLSVGGVPTDIYVARRRQILKALRGFQQRSRAIPELEEFLFTEILHSSFDLIEDVPGRILFQNNLMQLYRENIRLLSLGSREQMELLSAFHSIKTRLRDCIIEKSAAIKDSLVSFGACIEGSVTGSVIFPGVHVKKDAQVFNSVVMSNNRIGGGSLIQSSLILPYLGENGKNNSNIGSSVTIGSRRSSARNECHPSQVRDGITVLGLNPDIPANYRIEAACLIGADVAPQTLREREFLRKGASVP